MDAKEVKKPKGISIRLSYENRFIMQKFRNRSRVLSKAILETDLSIFQEIEEFSSPQAFVLSEEALNKLLRLPKGTRSKAVNYVISKMTEEDGKETSN